MVDKKEEKIELVREYIVPMRREFAKVPRYKKANKAIFALKQFIAKHMKVEDRDTRKVKLDMYLNEQIWHRGIKNPLHKVKVKASKKSDGTVYVELVDMPEVLKFKMQRAEKRASRVTKVNISHDEKNDHIEESEKTKMKEDEKNKISSDTSSKESMATAKVQKQTQQAKHEKNTTPTRKVLKK